jgi:hypothetical protein
MFFATHDVLYIEPATSKSFLIYTGRVMIGYRVPHYAPVFVPIYIMVLMERATSAVHGRGREGLKKPAGGGTYVGMSAQGLRMSHSSIPWRFLRLSPLHGAQPAAYPSM